MAAFVFYMNKAENQNGVSMGGFKKKKTCNYNAVCN